MMKLAGLASHLVSGVIGGLVVLAGNATIQQSAITARSPASIPLPAAPKEVVPEQVRAHCFQLVDASGKTVGLWGATPESESLFVCGADTTRAVTLRGGGNEATLRVAADGGSVYMQSDETGTFLSASADAQHKVSLSASKAEDDPPVISALGKRAAIKVLDTDAHSRVVLGHTETVNVHSGVDTTKPLSSITLYNETGRVEWEAPRD